MESCIYSIKEELFIYIIYLLILGSKYGRDNIKPNIKNKQKTHKSWEFRIQDKGDYD
jgi:hypothetical protein